MEGVPVRPQRLFHGTNNGMYCGICHRKTNVHHPIWLCGRSAGSDDNMEVIKSVICQIYQAHLLSVEDDAPLPVVGSSKVWIMDLPRTTDARWHDGAQSIRMFPKRGIFQRYVDVTKTG